MQSRRFAAPVLRHVRRLVLVRTALLLAVAPAVLGAAHSVPEHETAAPQPLPSIAWLARDATRFPGCVPSAEWNPHLVPGALVVRRLADGSDHRMAFDAAWGVNHDATEANDVWVLGSCR
jgi:hypothetical protein